MEKGKRGKERKGLFVENRADYRDRFLAFSLFPLSPFSLSYTRFISLKSYEFPLTLERPITMTERIRLPKRQGVIFGLWLALWAGNAAAADTVPGDPPPAGYHLVAEDDCG